MAGKDIILNFKINGIEKGTDQVDKLKNKITDLNTEFTSVESATEGFQLVDESTQSVSTSLTDLNENAEGIGPAFSESTQTASENLDNLKTSIDDVSNTSITNSNVKISNFGTGLKSATEGGEKAIKGLSKGFELLGGNTEKISLIEEGLNAVNAVLKGQAALTKAAFDDTSILGQIKALGQLGIAKIKDLFVTKSQTVATEQQAAATVQAGVAADGLKAKLLSTGLGALVVLVGSLVTAFLLFKESAIDVSKVMEGRMKTAADQLANSLSLLQAKLSLKVSGLDATITKLEKQLELTKETGGSLDKQAKIEKQLIELKEDKLSLQLQEATDAREANEKAIAKNNLQIQEVESKLKLAKLSKEELDVLKQQGQTLITNSNREEGGVKIKYTNLSLLKKHEEAVKNLNINEELNLKLQLKHEELTGKVTKNINDQVALSAELTASQEYSLPLLNAATISEKEKLRIQKESKIEELRQKNQQVQDLISDLNRATSTIERQNIIEKLKLLDTEDSKIQAIRKQQQLNNDLNEDGLNKQRESLIQNQESIIQSIESTETKSLEQRIEKENKLKSQKEKNEIELQNFNEAALKNQLTFEVKSESDAQKEITQVVKDAIKQRADLSNAKAKGKIDDLVDEEKKLQDEFTKVLQQGNIIRAFEIHKHLNQINADKRRAAAEALIDLEKSEKEELAKETDPVKRQKIIDFYKKLKKEIDGIMSGDGDSGPDADPTGGAVGRLQEIAGKINEFIQVWGGAFTSIMDSLFAAQDQLADRQQERIDADLEAFQNYLDTQNDLLEDQLDEKERMISDSNSRIEELQNILQNSSGKRHEFIQKQIDEEQRKLKKATAEKIALQNQIDLNKRLSEAKEEEAKAKGEKLDLERKKRERDSALVHAIINTALGVTQALATIPPPYSYVVAAITALAGAAEIAVISNQKFKEGGLLDEANEKLNRKVVTSDDLKKGTLIKNGSSHEDGGTIIAPGKEAEKGEFVVRKEAVENNLEVIEYINKNPAQKLRIIKTIPSTDNTSGNRSSGDNTFSSGEKTNSSSSSETGTKENVYSRLDKIDHDRLKKLIESDIQRKKQIKDIDTNLNKVQNQIKNIDGSHYFTGVWHRLIAGPVSPLADSTPPSSVDAVNEPLRITPLSFTDDSTTIEQFKEGGLLGGNSFSFVDTLGQLNLHNDNGFDTNTYFDNSSLFNPANLVFPDFNKIQSVVNNNNTANQNIDLTPIVDAIREIEIILSVEEFNRVNQRIVRVKEEAKV